MRGGDFPRFTGLEQRVIQQLHSLPHPRPQAWDIPAFDTAVLFRHQWRPVLAMGEAKYEESGSSKAQDVFDCIRGDFFLCRIDPYSSHSARAQHCPLSRP